MKTRKKSASRARTVLAGRRLQKIDALTIADSQGVKPIEDPKEACAPFWPKEESAEDINADVKRWRKEGRENSRP